MNISDNVSALLSQQLGSFFLFDRGREEDVLIPAVNQALADCEYCFSRIDNKYYQAEGKVVFNVFHSGQYCVFLYFLSRALFEVGQRVLADKVYYLNRMLNSVDLFYEVRLPRVFFLEHPLGSVLGRAEYGEYFSFAQNCTVGNNHGRYPKFGANVRMMSGAKVVGNCRVGDDVVFSAGVYVKDCDIPSCSIVFPGEGGLVIKPMPQDYFCSNNGFLQR